MTDPQNQAAQNQQARRKALSGVSTPQNLLAPTVSFESKGRILLLGPEHRIRLAVDALCQADADCFKRIAALVTEAMPQQIDAAMERAAELAEAQSGLTLYRLPLLSLHGYLGQFDVQVSVGGECVPLAKLVFSGEFFDAVLDLGAEPRISAALKPAGYFAPVSDSEWDAALASLPTLTGGFEKPRYFQLKTDHCAHAANGLSGCDRCLDVCPADAIRSLDGLIKIDSHLCHGAGGCATACPTSAIRYDYPQPRLLLESLERRLALYRQQGGIAPALLLHDAQSGQDWAQANLESLPGHWLPLQIEEMGSAGLDIWLSAMALGVSEVVLLSRPDSTSVSLIPDSIQSVLASEIALANRLLIALGMHSDADQKVGRDWVRMLTGDQLLAETTQADSAAVSHGGVACGVAPLTELDAGADKRELISRAMTHLYTQAVDPQPLLELSKGAAYGGLLIDTKACTLCMSCVAICPTGALSSAGNSPQLDFTEDPCVQCGLCTQACPEKALTLQPRYLLDPERRTQAQLLKKEEPFCCIRCEKPFATQSMVSMMLEKLAGHSMFAGAGLERLKMCEDCRVADIVLTDPGNDLFAHAKGRLPDSEEINLAQVEKDSRDVSKESQS